MAGDSLSTLNTLVWHTRQVRGCGTQAFVRVCTSLLVLYVYSITSRLHVYPYNNLTVSGVLRAGLGEPSRDA
jgi:hypothetical protein